MKEKQVFIHSLFRTGSTYLWNKFRQNDNYCCYYEPFHPCLQDVTPENIENILTTDFKAVHHPKLAAYYLHEYRTMLNPAHRGIPYFRKSFSFDEFCHTTVNPDALRYVSHLIENCGDRIPVFQFNRTAGRTRWFAESFPDSLNVYLFRKPGDQWQSYWELFQRTEFEIFFVMDLLIVSLNADAPPFLPLAKYLPLLKFNADQYQEEENFYLMALKSYTDEEKYLIFYYIWFWTLINNVLHADICMNINRICGSAGYRSAILDDFEKYGLARIDFDDAVVTEYPESRLPASRMKQIEQTARQLVLQIYDQAEINLFFCKFSREDREYFGFSPGQFEELKSADIPHQSGSKILKKLNFFFKRKISSNRNKMQVKQNNERKDP